AATLRWFRWTLRERGQTRGRRPSRHSGHGKSSATLCGWRLQLTDESSLLGSSRPHAPGSRQCARPAKIHYILPPSKRASELVLGRDGGGAEGIRTPDLRRATAALSQLSYGPQPRRAAVGVGQPGFEPATSA